MDANTPIKLPPFDWDKILVRCASGLLICFILAVMLRMRTVWIALEVITLVVMLFLLVLGCFALIRRYARPKK